MGYASETVVGINVVALKKFSLYIVSALHCHAGYKYCCYACFIIEEYFRQIGQV
jgi:hypothetical protein